MPAPLIFRCAGLPIRCANLPTVEPFRTKIVASLPRVVRAERERLLAEAGFNPSLVAADKVPFDLLSDSGAGALSDRQAAELLTGDEAYAGSRDFAKLRAAVTELFGFDLVVPVHQGRGAENLVARTMLSEAAVVASNVPFETTVAHIRKQNARAIDVVGSVAPPFAGDLDVAALGGVRHREGEALAFVVVGMTCNALGGRPVSMRNLEDVQAWCRREGLPLVVDGSRVFENAWFSAQAEPAWQGRPVADVVRAIGDLADVLYMSGKKDGLNKIGGFVAVRDRGLYRRMVDQCLMFEGMPSYGGMAGRDMAALATGLREGADDRHLEHRIGQVRRLGDRLRAAGVPFWDPPGGHCIVLDAARFAPTLTHPGCALAAALYVAGGIRGAAFAGTAGGPRGGSGGLFHQAAGAAAVNLVRLAVPRRVYTEAQLAHVADAVAHVWNHRGAIAELRVVSSPPGRAKFATRFEPVGADGGGVGAGVEAGAGTDGGSEAGTGTDGGFGRGIPAIAEPGDSVAPFVRAVVERFEEIGHEGRRAPLERAGYSTFALDAAEVAIDLFTDSGTAAMSTAQWARQWLADDTLIGSCSAARFQEAVRETYGFEHALATHQGRGAEAVLFEVLGARGRAVTTNMQFFSTAQHIRRVGCRLVDVICDDAYDLTANVPFKGNVDLARLGNALADDDVAVAIVSLTVNDAGGQPVSRENLQAVSHMCRERGVPLWLDATRAAENAWFVRRHEGESQPLGAVLHDLMDLADGIWVSGKKDLLVNIGGFLAFRDDALLPRMLDASVLYEGMPGSGGLAGRDLEFMAIGMREMVGEPYMAHRVGQIRRLWERLKQGGVPVLDPPGGHSVMVDAEAFLPHVASDQFPGHALANALFLDSGVRAMPVFTHLCAGQSAGPVAGSDRAKREMLRLTIPRRVYSQAQLDHAADALVRLYQQRDRVHGLQPVEHSGMFPFITGRFAPAKLAGV